MTNIIQDSYLSIETPLSNPKFENYKLKSWPPEDEWPVIVKSNGSVVSKYGDSLWNLYPWANKSIVLNFGDDDTKSKKCTPIDKFNANILRLIVTWWIWGQTSIKNPGTLKKRFSDIRPLFSYCSDKKIKSTELYKYPHLIGEIADLINNYNANDTIRLMHEIYERRDVLGFYIFNRDQLIKIQGQISQHLEKQTPYIPPRIWKYQISRLKECISDFTIHKDKIFKCYDFCVNAYIKNYGSFEAMYFGQKTSEKNPFSKPTYRGKQTGRKFYGEFEDTAEKFGILNLLKKWLREDDSEYSKIGVTSLTSYINLVSKVSLAYILNLTLMRISEGESLRADCLVVENDPKFGKFYLIKARTTKTINDDSALWPTSPEAVVAIEAMKSIAMLQRECRRKNPLILIDDDEYNNPHLIYRSGEPWANINFSHLNVRPTRQAYDIALTKRFSKLFDKKELTITEQDISIARLVNPSLDNERYKVGSIWNISWHQLRRTGAVNMQASGLISDSSLQYLLKHATRAMSLYYARGFSNLALDDSTRTLYIKTMYEVLNLELKNLSSDRYISPHGIKRKDEVIKLINLSDIKKLKSLSKNGEVNCREIILGYCMSNEPCQYGGIDSVAHCGGGASGKPCSDVIYDKEKIESVKFLLNNIKEKMEETDRKSPLYESLVHQTKSLNNFINSLIQTNE